MSPARPELRLLDRDGDADWLRLDCLAQGSSAEVVELACGASALRRLGELGIVEGAILRVRRRAPFGGPVLVEVDGSVVALGRGLARRVIVRMLR